MKAPHVLLTVLALSTLPQPALSQGALDPPRYDTSVLCYRRASVAEGFSSEAMMQCQARQRKTYDDIRKRWNQLPEEIQTGCDEQTRATRVLDYESLYSCIITQLRRIPPGPVFEYPLTDKDRP